MSRAPRLEIGLNVACAQHPRVMIWPRMSLDGTMSMREAGPRTVRGVSPADESEAGGPRYSVRCPHQGCVTHIQCRRERVRWVLKAMAQYQMRGVWNVTDRELVLMVRNPARAPEYLLSRGRVSR